MSRFHPLAPQSIIGILSLYDAQISADTSAQVVVDQFQRLRTLPGIIVTRTLKEINDTVNTELHSEPIGSIVLGVLSRQAFFERGCLESGDRGWNQPIQTFLHTEEDFPLMVSDQTPILEVALKIRQRSQIMSLEPIVVTFRDGSLRLIDSRDVLFAQATILSEETTTHAKDQTIQDYQLQVENQSHLLADLSQMVNVRNITLQNQQQHLERQQYALFNHTEVNQQLRQRLTDIRQVLSAEMRRIVQDQLELMGTIAASAEELILSDISLAKELEVVIALSETIQRVSRQARFLKLHSAIFINRPNSVDLIGFSQIMEGIESLMIQTLDADQRVSDSVGKIKLNIIELAHVAQEIAKAIAALIQQIKNSDELLAKLITLVDRPDSDGSLLAIEQNSELLKVSAKMRTITLVSEELGEIYQSEKTYNLRTMLQNLESRLRRR